MRSARRSDWNAPACERLKSRWLQSVAQVARERAEISLVALRRLRSVPICAGTSRGYGPAPERSVPGSDELRRERSGRLRPVKPRVMPSESLRRLGGRAVPAGGDRWLFDPCAGEHASRLRLAPRPRRLRRVLDQRRPKLLRTTVGDVFSVTEGVRTGARNVFIFTLAEPIALPSERAPLFQTSATEGRNIRAGHIDGKAFSFLPGPRPEPRTPMEPEAELAEQLPTIYALFKAGPPLPRQSGPRCKIGTPPKAKSMVGLNEPA